MKIRFTTPARRDIVAISRWLGERSPKAADAAVDAIIKGVDLLSEFPRIGFQLSSGKREKLVRFGRDGYVLTYLIEGETVIIVRVRHTRQDR